MIDDAIYLSYLNNIPHPVLFPRNIFRSKLVLTREKSSSTQETSQIIFAMAMYDILR